MKCFMTLALVLFSGLSFVADALADGNSQNGTDSRYRKRGNLGSIFELVDEIRKHRDDDKDENPKPVPIDPGMGNGQPTADPVTPPSRPGYVWVGDHWERERAPQQTTTVPTKPGFVWVGDHWERERATSTTTPTFVNQPFVPVTTNTTGNNLPTGGTIVVRDHRTTTSNVIVRDHRTGGTDASQSSGGVVVKSSPIVRDHRDSATNTGKGGGGGVLDTLGDAVSGVGNAVGNVGDAVGDAVISAGNKVGIGYGTVTPARGTTTKKPNWKPATEGAVVRDHR